MAKKERDNNQPPRYEDTKDLNNEILRHYRNKLKTVTEDAKSSTSIHPRHAPLFAELTVLKWLCY